MTGSVTHPAGIDQWSKLAALRFVLASIVALNHLGEMLPLGYLSVFPMLGTFEAILGFLLVSGYSIGVSYRREPSRFLWRRVKRIYPVYLASLLVMAFVLYLGHEQAPSVWEWTVNLLFLNQFVVPDSIVGPAWSLSLEFWLYCLTPLLFTLSDKTVKWIAFGSFAAFCGYTAGRTLFHWVYYSGTSYGLNLIVLSFIWLSGLRLARTSEPAAVMKTIVAMFALYLLLSFAIQGGYRLKNGELSQFFSSDLVPLLFRVATLAAVALLFRNILRRGKAGRPSAWMRTLGDISFPLYMLHVPVFELLRHTRLQSPTLYFGVAMVASAVAYRGLDLYSQRRHAPTKMPVAA